MRHRVYAAGVTCLCIMLIGVMIIQSIGNIKAQSVAVDSAGLLDGKRSFSNVNIPNGGTSLELQRGEVGAWSYDSGTELPPNVGYANDVAMTRGPNKSQFIMEPISEQCQFMRYDTEMREYTYPAQPPIGCGAGLSLVYDNNETLYFLPGFSQQRLFKYSVGSDTWTELAQLPSDAGGGASMSFATQGSNSYLYLLRGLGSSSFLRYEINTNSWSTMAQFPAINNVNAGYSSAWDGGNYIYVYTNLYGEFKRYSMATNTWTAISANYQYYYKHTMFFRNGQLVSLSNNISGETLFMRTYNPTTQVWTDLPRPPITHLFDGNIPFTYDGERYAYMYASAAYRTNLYRYDFQNNTWGTKNILDQNIDNSGAAHQMIYDGANTLYFVGGVYAYNSDRVYKYDITTGQTTRIGTQFGDDNGWAGVYYNNGLYFMDYSSGKTFQRYDITTNDWTKLADSPYNSGWGASIIDGGDGYLYATFQSTNKFSRYNVSTNTWEALTNGLDNTDYESEMTRVGRNIYLLVTNNTGQFNKYNMDTGVWSTSKSIPNGSIQHGAFLVGDSTRYLYAGLGTRSDENNKRFFRYDTQTDNWERMADIPQATNVLSSAIYDKVRNKVLVNQSTIGTQLFEWAPSSDAYVRSGTWYSKAYDLQQVESWGQLQSTINGSGAVFYARSSQNGRVWSDWYQVASGAISAPTARYLQLKLEMTGDGASTPNVSNIVINYGQENAAPTIPSSFTVTKDTADATALVSGQTYPYQHPVMKWGGASDGANGAGIDGYYVYFGTNSSADPVTDGSYQKTSSYTVTTPMVAGDVYYVRIKVKDKLGNISSAATYFSYRYWYISPPGSVVKTSDSDFGEGSNTGVAIADGSMKLRQSATGKWNSGTIDPLPGPSRGGAMKVIGDELYIMAGANTTAFWRYNLTSHIWETLATVPGNVSDGSSLTYDGSRYLYAIRGQNSSSSFYRYDTLNNSWLTLPNLPANANAGSDMAYIGNNTIAIFFTGTREFYFYDVVNKTFASKTSYPSAVALSGSGMWYEGGDTIYVYLGMSEWHTGQNQSLVAYSIANDTWKLLADSPTTPSYTQNNLVGDKRGNLYVFGNSYTNNVPMNAKAMKYSIATDSWQTIPDYPGQSMYGTVASDGDRYIYIIPSNAASDSRRMIRYDTWNNKFDPDTPAPDGWQRTQWDVYQNSWEWRQYNATTAVYDGSKYIYTIGASEGSWSRFAKYDIKTGATEYLPPPYAVGLGGSLAMIGKDIYYLEAKNTTNFFKFDSNKKQWISMATVPNNVYRPGGSTLIRLSDNTLLAFAGNNKLAYKYTPDSGVGTWARMADVPGNVLNGSAVYDINTNLVYVVAGNGTNQLYSYNVAANTWSTLANLPETTSYGSAMAIDSGKLYVALGNYTNRSYVYDISANSWVAGKPTPETFRYGSMMLRIDSTTVLGLAGESSADFWEFRVPGANQAYEGEAIHISQPIPLAGIYDYAGVQAEADTPDGTSIEFFTRTSEDGTNWDKWERTAEVKKYNGRLSSLVKSSPKRYIQIKTVLSSLDNRFTPTVGSYTINYYYDIETPTNPTVVEGYTNNTKVTTIANNTWYNHSSPLFDWPDPGQAGGATDGPLGSNIAGYWVYVGTDPTASPKTSGVFVPQTEYTPNLTTSGVYYVRIQAQDVTGNVDPNIFDPFIYKFDNTPPTTPSMVTVTPSGFTARNLYTFVWPNAFDSHSGISKYCYHTGANSGPFAVEICQDSREAIDLTAAYRAGTNVFYVRTLDSAGNYSDSYTTTSYYYSTDPPSPVTNMRAIPPTSTQNLFAFTWDLPATFAGDPDLLEYCYSINILPSSLNSTCTTEKFIPAIKAATQQGTNIIYMVAKDEAGNASWNNYASANFVANTVSPGIPLNLVITDTSDRNSRRWSLTPTWSKPTFEGNGIETYVVERSSDQHTFEVIGRTSTTAFVDLDIQPATTYYYRVRAADGLDNRGAPSAVVAQAAKGSYAEPPDTVVPPAAVAGFDQANINWATGRAATSFVYYGSSPTNLSQSKGTLDTVTQHTLQLTGLLPSTTYYYKVQSFDTERSYSLEEANSQIYSFKTSAAARVNNVSSSDVTYGSAVINWQTSVATQSRVEYGLTQDYALAADGETTEYSTNHLVKLTSLASGSTYHYRIVAKTPQGSTIYSDDYTFTTIARPSISNIRFQPIDNEVTSAVKVSWATNVPTSSTVRYSALGTNLESSASELVTNHEIILHDLAGSTSYLLTIEGRDKYGNLVASEPQKWQSSVDTRAPQLSQVSLSVTTMQTVGATRAQLIVSWKTDEPSTSQVIYDKASSKNLSKSTPLDTEPTTNHIVIISGLDLAEIYKTQIISKDILGNTTNGVVTSVVTPDQEVNVLDGVLRIMQRLFRY